MKLVTGRLKCQNCPSLFACCQVRYPCGYLRNCANTATASLSEKYKYVSYYTQTLCST